MKIYKSNSLAILLTTYNGEKFLKEQLDSLILQTYKNFRIFISDDLSSDSTISIISDYCEKYPEKITNIQNNTKFGNARDNFFNLLLQVDAPFYMFCDQDDVWMPDKIEKTISEYKQYSDNDAPFLVHSDLQVVDGNLNIISSSFMEFTRKRKIMTWKNYLVENNNVVGCTMGINKVLADLYKKNYLKLNNKKILMHDSFFAQLVSLTGNLLYIDEPLIKYRQHNNNSIGAIKKTFSLGFLVKKISQLKESKNLQIKREENIAEILKCCNDIDVRKAIICKEFSELHKQTKIKRILFVIKNRLFRNSVSETLYMFMAI